MKVEYGNGEVLIKVSSEDNCNEVGSAVMHHSCHEGFKTTVRAIGAAAGNVATKGIAVARRGAAGRGLDLLARLGFADVEGRKDGEVTALVWRIVVD